MGQMQPIMFDEEKGLFEIALPSPLLTRDDRVRMEGAHAARCGFTRHDNPYRSQSADGVSWRAGFDAEGCSASRADASLSL